MSLHTLSLREFGSCLQSKADLGLKKFLYSLPMGTWIQSFHSDFNYKWDPSPLQIEITTEELAGTSEGQATGARLL